MTGRRVLVALLVTLALPLAGSAGMAQGTGTSPDQNDSTGADANQAPKAAFSFTVDELTVLFNASASADPDGDALTFAWAFGDGDTGEGKTLRHKFDAAGTYTVELVVTDAQGATDSKKIDVTVGTAANDDSGTNDPDAGDDPAGGGASGGAEPGDGNDGSSTGDDADGDTDAHDDSDDNDAKDDEDDDWEDEREGREAARARQEERLRQLQKVRDELRDKLGHIDRDNGDYAGRYVSFAVDRPGGVLEDVAVNDHVLFAAIHLPLEPGVKPIAKTSGNQLFVHGEEWKMHVTDAVALPMRFATDDDAGPFTLVLPSAATVEPKDYGVAITYPVGDGQALVARLRGDVQIDGPSNLSIDDEAKFLLSTDRLLLPAVNNAHRAELEKAFEDGTLGAEASVLKADDADDSAAFVMESTAYDDLTVELAAEQIEADPETGAVAAYVLTIDGHVSEGRTVAVAFEAGMLDFDQVVFRHLNVVDGTEIESPIVMASSIQDVLDPNDDGLIVEYWIIEDADGTQLLASLPSFSVHEIQLLDMGSVVIERPALVAGVLGAVIVVAVATRGLFRRPSDE